MSDHPRPEPAPGAEPDDPAANTEMFAAFQARQPDPEPRRAVGAPFRIATLIGGLVLLAVLVWLLFP